MFSPFLPPPLVNYNRDAASLTSDALDLMTCSSSFNHSFDSGRQTFPRSSKKKSTEWLYNPFRHVLHARTRLSSFFSCYVLEKINCLLLYKKNLIPGLTNKSTASSALYILYIYMCIFILSYPLVTPTSSILCLRPLD